jgi:hypothetical protein
MMNRWMGVMGIMGVMLCFDGCKERPKLDPAVLRTLQWREEAQQAIQKCCSNDVVGITRIVNTQVIDLEDHPDKWTGEASVEFINRVGGVERTNFPVRFFMVSIESNSPGHIYCRMDGEEILRKEKLARGR